MPSFSLKAPNTSLRDTFLNQHFNKLMKLRTRSVLSEKDARKIIKEIGDYLELREIAVAGFGIMDENTIFVVDGEAKTFLNKLLFISTSVSDENKTAVQEQLDSLNKKLLMPHFGVQFVQNEDGVYTGFEPITSRIQGLTEQSARAIRNTLDERDLAAQGMYATMGRFATSSLMVV